MAKGKENMFEETYAASTVQFKLGSDDGSADEEGEGAGGGSYGWPTTAEVRRLATPQIYGKDIPQFIFDFGRGKGYVRERGWNSTSGTSIDHSRFELCTNVGETLQSFEVPKLT